MPDKEYEKEVTLVAYDAEQRYGSLREWAAELSGIDMHETRTTTDKWWELVYDFGRGEQKRRLRTTQYNEEIIKEAQEKLPSEWVRVEKHTSDVEHHVNNPSDAGNVIVEDIYDGLPDVLNGGIPKRDKSWYLGWMDERGKEDQKMHPDFHCKMGSFSFEEQRVLAKESEREDDNLYETMAEVPAMTSKVEMKAPSQEHIDKWTEQVITGAVKEISGFKPVGKVRFTACETTVTQEGECYNI